MSKYRVEDNQFLLFSKHKQKNKFVVNFHVAKDDKIVVIFKRLEDGENNWEVAFERRSPFTGKMTVAVTGAGHAHKIFSNVLKIIKEFIIDMKPSSLWVWSLERDDDDSRTKLYDRLLKKLPYQITDRANFGGSAVWVLKPIT